jgi:hypothetical protein
VKRPLVPEPRALSEIPARLRDLTPQQLFDLSTLTKRGGYKAEDAERIVRGPKRRVTWRAPK